MIRHINVPSACSCAWYRMYFLERENTRWASATPNLWTCNAIWRWKLWTRCCANMVKPENQNMILAYPDVKCTSCHSQSYWNTQSVSDVPGAPGAPGDNTVDLGFSITIKRGLDNRWLGFPASGCPSRCCNFNSIGRRLIFSFSHFLLHGAQMWSLLSWIRWWNITYTSWCKEKSDPRQDQVHQVVWWAQNVGMPCSGLPTSYKVWKYVKHY